MIFGLGVRLLWNVGSCERMHLRLLYRAGPKPENQRPGRFHFSPAEAQVADVIARKLDYAQFTYDKVSCG